jgi:hypothetical protein
MQIPFNALAQESLQQLRDTLQRVRHMHDPGAPDAEPAKFSGPVETPKPDAMAWEDTEIDVRRLVP